MRFGCTVPNPAVIERRMAEIGFHRRIAAGDYGLAGGALRALLRVAESCYAAVVSRRNARFDRACGVHRAGAPVVSVGNLTVGGTGKTPIVIHLLRTLQSLDLRPAVVSRGYQATDRTGNDEAELVRRRCPGVPVICDADRVRGAARAVTDGADVIVLDDGFQHRRLARDLDVVAIDATCPFGFGHLLPRGTLREPIASLARADLIVLTRCDQVPGATLEAIDAEVHRVVPRVPLLRCRHSVKGLVTIDGVPCDADLRGKRVVAFAGIARPEAFLHTIRSLGANVVGTRWWPDHAAYRLGDLAASTWAKRFPPFDFLITTEKDAVKLNRVRTSEDAAVLVVQIDIELHADQADVLKRILADRIASRPA